MLVFDLFSGTGSSTQAFKDAGHTVISFEMDDSFEATEHINVFSLQAREMIAKYGQPNFVWASPPCTAFSVASIGHHWANGGANPTPKTESAKQSQDLVAHTVQLIKDLNPDKGWLIENPRGMLRKLPVVEGLPRTTVTYCQYGDSRMKPTDLWGRVPGWTPRVACKNGMLCHEAAPRGARTGTQGIVGARERSRIPYALGEELLEAMLQ
jgi:hypothetical protein